MGHRMRVVKAVRSTRGLLVLLSRHLVMFEMEIFHTKKLKEKKGRKEKEEGRKEGREVTLLSINKYIWWDPEKDSQSCNCVAES